MHCPVFFQFIFLMTLRQVQFVKEAKKIGLTVDSGVTKRVRAGRKLYMQSTFYVGKIPDEFYEARAIVSMRAAASSSGTRSPLKPFCFACRR